MTDDDLFEQAAAAVSVPRRDPASSFVLHAPLELLARRGLLGHLPPDVRPRARAGIARLVAEYRSVAPLDPPPPPRRGSDPAGALLAAVDAGDLDATDAAAAQLAATGTAADLVALGPALAPRLAAAGHAAIYLHLLPRVAAGSRAALGLLRPLARELARDPGWRVTWHEHRPLGGSGDPAALADALEHALDAAPALGRPEPPYIYPIVHQAEVSGAAADLLAPVLPADPSPDAAGALRRALLRSAARWMLTDDPAEAPYGWSHALTIPQGIAGRAGSEVTAGAGVTTGEAAALLAVAATHALALRAALSTGPVPARYAPAPTGLDPRVSLAAEPAVAAATTFHAPDADLDAIGSALATYAAGHPDAHLVKYTLACFDAGADDPAHRRLFLAAAAHLGAWWRAQDDSPYKGFPG